MYFTYPIVILILLLTIAPIDAGAYGGMIYESYSSDDTSLSIVFPDGWVGFEVKNLHGHGIIIYPDVANKTPEVFIELLLVDQPDTSNIQNYNLDFDPGLFYSDCQIVDLSYLSINKMYARESLATCKKESTEQPYNLVKMYSFSTADMKMVHLTFTANSQLDYNNNIAKFEESVRTLNIRNTTDIRHVEEARLKLQSYIQTVVIGNSTNSINIKSNLQIMNFSFNSKLQEISFDIKNNDAHSRYFSLSVPLDGLIGNSGSYNVYVDGSPTRNFVIMKDKLENKTSMEIGIFREGDASITGHHIKISGPRAVPEFPLSYMGIIFISAIIIFTITNRWIRIR